MKMAIAILIFCLVYLVGCTVIFIDVQRDLDCGDVTVDKAQDIKPATDANVSLIPK